MQRAASQFDGTCSPQAREPAEQLARTLTSVACINGLVNSSSGTLSSVSTTKNASPCSPTFMKNGTGCELTVSVTRFSPARKTWSLPNRTWNGEHERIASPPGV